MKTRDEPYVSIGLICERVLVEKDEVQSFVRIVDMFNVPPGRAAEIRLILVAGLKSDVLTGPYEIVVELQGPGEAKPIKTDTFLVHLQGGGRGANLVVNLALKLTDRGVFWFNIKEKSTGTVLTRVPFTIRDQAN